MCVRQKFLAPLLLIVPITLIIAKTDNNSIASLRKPLVLSSNNFDGNRIDCDMQNNGMFVSHLVSGRSGLSWPKGNGTQTIYASGVWLGGLINNRVHVSAGEYAGEFISGPWGSDKDDETHKIYKVNKSDLSYPQYSDDFQNWPVEYGAPWVDNNINGVYEPLPNGPDHPEFIGDQVLWMVMNDGDEDSHFVFNTKPMGFEIQRTVFGFDREDEYGDMMFIKDLIINRGDNTIEDMYIGLWSDPDLGDAGDDFVGCDTTLGMGIVYNDGDDVNFTGFSEGTPAVGYDFFQGPLVPSQGEMAYMFERDIPNMKNLQMTSFIKLTKSQPFWDPNNAEEAYYYLQGLDPYGNPPPVSWSGGSRFTVPGDPTKDTGPNDSEYVDGDIHPSDDRRFLMSSGPFTIVPDDSQEVVYAILHAADGTWDNSYLKLKEVDIMAQRAYDAHFISGDPPQAPEVGVTELSDQIILTWDDGAESYVSADLIDVDPVTFEPTDYAFEGYNVYQCENEYGTREIRKIATFDVINDVKVIMDDVFDEDYGVSVNIPVQDGADTGIKRSFLIDHDYFDNTPLKLNRDYYFAVTAYGYNPYGKPKTLESTKNIYKVRPQVPNYWEPNESVVYGSRYEAEHLATQGDGYAFVNIVDPTKITGNDYKITFNNDLTIGDSVYSITNWNLENTTTNEMLLTNQVIMSGKNQLTGDEVSDYSSKIVEGLQVIIETSEKGIKQVSETDQDDNILDVNVGVYPPSLGTTGYILSHRDHANANWEGRTHDRFDYWGTDDIVINFAEESVAWDYINETVNGTVPYSIYRHKNPSGEVKRLFAGYWDSDLNGIWSIGEPWGDYGAPGYEPIYCWQGYDAAGNEISYDPANAAQYIADNSLLTSANTTWGGGAGDFKYPFLTATLVVLYLDGSTPPWGNKIWIMTTKPLMEGDVFTFSADTLRGKTIEYDPENIKAWPNPYFGYNPEEEHIYDRQIHFTQLPETGKCIIRIFDLSGTLVRRIVHDNGTQFEIWNLANDKNVYVASGMYIVHIETEEGEKILKLAVIQPD